MNMDRSASREREKDFLRENKLDITQAIMEVVNSNATVPKNFAALLNTNSNDSVSNGPSEYSDSGKCPIDLYIAFWTLLLSPPPLLSDDLWFSRPTESILGAFFYFQYR